MQLVFKVGCAVIIRCGGRGGGGGGGGCCRALLVWAAVRGGHPAARGAVAASGGIRARGSRGSCTAAIAAPGGRATRILAGCRACGGGQLEPVHTRCRLATLCCLFSNPSCPPCICFSDFWQICDLLVLKAHARHGMFVVVRSISCLATDHFDPKRVFDPAVSCVRVASLAARQRGASTQRNRGLDIQRWAALKEQHAMVSL